MRGVIGAAAALVCLAACDGNPPRPAGLDYLFGSAADRRQALLASLGDTDNGYARLRRERYATGDARDWDALPVWNPRVEVVTASDLADARQLIADGPFAVAPRALALPQWSREPGATPGGPSDDLPERLERLGREAFFRYPVQLVPLSARLGLQNVARYGLWVDDAHGVGGLVRAEMADGSARMAYSCATCHAAQAADTRLIIGVGNASLDLGTWLADATDPAASSSPADVSALLAWGRGRVDVVTASGRMPVAIPDLRPTRWLTHLHHEGNVLQRDPQALAIRLETLLITTHGQALRPPREITLGLALYLWSLADALPDAQGAEPRGRAVFAAARCSACHAGEGLTGPPVDAAVVGTDPTVAADPDRGTGRYRVPSLRGVGSRGILLHDGSFRGLETFMVPRRGVDGPPGAHPFGLELPDAQRVDLIAFLRAL